MLNSKEYIETGILEMYALGICNDEETKAVEMMASLHPAIHRELTLISQSLEDYAMANAIAPNPLIRPFLLATIDYTQRLKNGEPVSFPPLLNENSLIADYHNWLNRVDMVSPETDSIYAKIIGYSPEATTAIVWLKDYSPHEVHDDEYERFLIVEGTCDIIVEDEVNHLVPGDYFTIPLHKNHLVKVTSSITCKVILQRVAA
jgi:mannose-6-phosphate isomerase-like protein (cupin superfamily)